jgi:hypothetical protein
VLDVGGASGMASIDLDPAALKRILKDALAETLRGQRELFHDVFAEALEGFALAEAIRGGQQTRRASREKDFRSLRNKA